MLTALIKYRKKDKRGAGAAAVLRHGGDGDEDGSREGRERSTKTNYVLF